MEPDRNGLGVVWGRPWNGVSVRMEEDGGVLLRGRETGQAGTEEWREKVSLLGQNVQRQQEGGSPWPWTVVSVGDGPSTEAASLLKVDVLIWPILLPWEHGGQVVGPGDNDDGGTWHQRRRESQGRGGMLVLLRNR